MEGDITKVNSHHAVVDFPCPPTPLPLRPGRVHAALGDAGFVDQTDRLRIGVFAGDERLTAIPQLLLVPLDRFEKTLQCPWGNARFQRHRFDGLTFQRRELSLHISLQQVSNRSTNRILQPMLGWRGGRQPRAWAWGGGHTMRTAAEGNLLRSVL